MLSQINDQDVWYPLWIRIRDPVLFYSWIQIRDKIFWIWNLGSRIQTIFSELVTIFRVKNTLKFLDN
jgi:hypothetical protein